MPVYPGALKWRCYNSLEPDTRLVPFNEGKEPLRNWLRVLIVSIVTLSELLQSLLIIRGHNSVDCLHR